MKLGWRRWWTLSYPALKFFELTKPDFLAEVRLRIKVIYRRSVPILIIRAARALVTTVLYIPLNTNSSER